MAITINIYYKGNHESARKFAEEIIANGIADKIHKEEGNEGVFGKMKVTQKISKKISLQMA